MTVQEAEQLHTDLDAMLQGCPPATPEAMYGEAAYLLYRLWATAPDLAQAAIREGYRMWYADLEEMHRDDDPNGDRASYAREERAS